MLLENRSKDPELAKKTIPLLESEVILDPELLDKLETYSERKLIKNILNKRSKMKGKARPIKKMNKVL